MLKMSEAKITRGERKKRILDEAKFKEDTKTIEWINTQPTWAEDINYYLENKPKPIITKSKKEK